MPGVGVGLGVGVGVGVGLGVGFGARVGLGAGVAAFIPYEIDVASVEIIRPIAVKTDTIVIPCSRNKV